MLLAALLYVISGITVMSLVALLYVSGIAGMSLAASL
jgi:hypothetical protein